MTASPAQVGSTTRQLTRCWSTLLQHTLGPAQRWLQWSNTLRQLQWTSTLLLHPLRPTRRWLQHGASTSRVRSTKGAVTLCTDMLEKVERILRQTVRKSPSVRSVEHERIFKERRRVRLSSPKGPLPGLLGGATVNFGGEYLLYA